MLIKPNDSFALSIILAILLPFSGNSQTCNSYFYDPGGPNGNVPANSSASWTFCPDVPGDMITMTFLKFRLEPFYDRLYVHDGPDTSFPLIASPNNAGAGSSPSNCHTTFGPGGWWGSNIPTLTVILPGPFTSTHPSGCLTFQLCTDGTLQYEGWEAYATCAPPNNCSPPVISLGSVLNCNDSTFSIQATVVSPSVPETTPILIVSTIVNGDVVSDSGGIIPNISGSTITIENIPRDQFTILRFDPIGFQCASQHFLIENSIECPTVLQCGTPLEQWHCYSNNDQTKFFYQSPNGEPVSLRFNSGLVNIGDYISIFDGLNANGTFLYNSYISTNLENLQVTALSGSLYMTVTSNSSGACSTNSSGTSSWNWNVYCGDNQTGCTNNAAINYQPIATINDGSCVFNGNLCSNPIPVTSLPYTMTSNTSYYGDNYNLSSVPGSAIGSFGTGVFTNTYMKGNEVVYQFTATTSSFIDISVTGHESGTGVYVFTGCPWTSALRWHLETGTEPRLINAVPVNAGQTIQIVISTSAPIQTTPYTIDITETIFDCPLSNMNFDQACTLPNGVFGFINSDCECSEFPFVGCVSGVLFGVAIPKCDGTTINLPLRQANQFSNVTLFQGVEYTFSTTPNPNVPSFYITITTTPADGQLPEVLATGINSLTWVSTVEGVFRFYVHSTPNCAVWPTGSLSQHTRSVVANCNNIVYNCPDFQTNEGDPCAGVGFNGVLDSNCTCIEIDFPGCTAGVNFGNMTPNCNTQPITTVNNVWANQYSNVNVIEGFTYTFTTQNNPLLIPGFFITIANSTGVTVLAASPLSVTWTANFSGAVRFYTHSSPTCINPISGSQTAHSNVVSVDCSSYCPGVGLNIGQPCDDGDPSTLFDQIQADCTCVSIDCQSLGLNIGDVCITNGNPGTVSANCDCVPDSNCNVNGGTVSTDSPRLNLCKGDGAPDIIQLNVIGNTTPGRFGLVRSSDLQIIASNSSGIFNMELYPAGSYFAGYVAVENLTDLNSITNVADLAGCFDLSNQILITSLAFNGGTISTESPSNVCGGNVQFTVAGNQGQNSRYALLNENFTTILAQNTTGIFNFGNLPVGIYKVVHISYANSVNLAAIIPPNIPGCVAMSNIVTMVRQTCAGAVITSSPNPTTGASVATFSVTEDVYGTLEVYDMHGRKLAELFSQLVQKDKEYQFEYNGTGLPNGVYIYRLVTDNELLISKFLIAR